MSLSQRGHLAEGAGNELFRCIRTRWKGGLGELVLGSMQRCG